MRQREYPFSSIQELKILDEANRILEASETLVSDSSKNSMSFLGAQEPFPSQHAIQFIVWFLT